MIWSRRHGEVDYLGPAFVSYRDNDGAGRARDLAWAMRSAGLPVWLDKDDLPPGETNYRLNEALTGGLSAGVLLVTPDSSNSRVIRRLELPRLIRLGRDPDFILAIANGVRRTGGVSGTDPPDYEAPDRLLRTWWQRPRLRGYKQHRYFDADHASTIALALAMHRMARVRQAGTQELELDLQTRGSQPGAWRRPAPLVVRTLPPSDAGHRAPPPQAWRAFAPFLDKLPALIEEAGTPRVRIVGGAHMSAAVAVGAALPTTAGVDLIVVDTSGRSWADSRTGQPAELEVSREQHHGAGRIAVLVDCASGSAHNTFSELVQDRLPTLASSMNISTKGVVIDPADSGALADRLAGLIREEAVASQAVTVDLCVRMPFPLAVMLGRRLNTLELQLYEWEAENNQPRYVPSLTVASGRGGVVVPSPM